MGENAASRLKKEGADVAKTDVLTISVHAVYFPPRTGHSLSPVWHPRGELTIADPGIKRLVDEIVAEGEVREPLLVREDWIADAKAPGGKRKVFTCVDGAGRAVSGCIAEGIMHKAGRLTKAEGTKRVPVDLRVKVRLFVGDNKALLLARQRADADPSKRPHSPSVLAMEFIQYRAEGGTAREFFEVMPRFVLGHPVNERDVDNLDRWGNLHEEVRNALDAGTCPFGLYRALLDEPRDQQPAMMARLIEQGAKTVKGATLVKTRDAKVAAATPPAQRPGPAPSSDLPRLAAPPVVVVRRPHPIAMRKALEGATGLGLKDETGEEQETAIDTAPTRNAYDMGQADGFMAGVRYALGEADIDALGLPEALVKHIKSAQRPEKK